MDDVERLSDSAEGGGWKRRNRQWSIQRFIHVPWRCWCHMSWSAVFFRDLEALEGSRLSRLCSGWSLVFGLRFGKWLCQGVRVALGHTMWLPCVCVRACYVMLWLMRLQMLRAAREAVTNNKFQWIVLYLMFSALYCTLYQEKHEFIQIWIRMFQIFQSTLYPMALTRMITMSQHFDIFLFWEKNIFNTFDEAWTNSKMILQ